MVNSGWACSEHRSLIISLQTITWMCCITYMFSSKVPDPLLGPKGVRALLLIRGLSG